MRKTGSATQRYRIDCNMLPKYADSVVRTSGCLDDDSSSSSPVINNGTSLLSKDIIIIVKYSNMNYILRSFSEIGSSKVMACIMLKVTHS